MPEPSTAATPPTAETDLVARCRRGEEAAWKELVARHGRSVFAIAYRFAGRVEEAEDLAQEVFVKVHRVLDRYRPAEGALGTWIGTVARNHAIDHYRRQREERRRVVGDEETLRHLPTHEEGPLRAAEREEKVRLVHDGLRALPAELREPIVLCDLRGLSYEEAAALLEVPLGTVKSRLNRARLELARRLAGRAEPLPFQPRVQHG